MKLALDHVVFPVFDAKASHAFYAEVLGLELVDAIHGDDWGGKPWLMMIFELGDKRELVLVALAGARRPARDDVPSDARHLAFAVETAAEQDAWRARLRERGVAFREEDHGTQK